MIEPVAVNDIMAAAIAGALIILFGAAYFSAQACK